MTPCVPFSGDAPALPPPFSLPCLHQRASQGFLAHHCSHPNPTTRDVATGLGRPGVGKCLLLPIVSGNFVRLDGLLEQCMQPL